MEISIDVGKHVVDEIQNIAQSENKDFDVISSKIFELGLRVYQSSKSEDNDKKHDPLLVNIFRKNLYKPNKTLGDDFERFTNIVSAKKDVFIINKPSMPRMVTVGENYRLKDLIKQKERTRWFN